jgi:hypothetical protein
VTWLSVTPAQLLRTSCTGVDFRFRRIEAGRHEVCRPLWFAITLVMRSLFDEGLWSPLLPCSADARFLGFSDEVEQDATD